MMSTNHRKRKHRSTHHRDSQHSTHRSYGPSSPEQPTFLGHHDAYLNLERDSYRGEDADPNPLQALYIQAYEADIVYGPDSLVAARSLEVVEYKTVVSEDGTERAVGTVPKIGSALIKWGGGGGIPSSASTSSRIANMLDEEDEDAIPTAVSESSEDKRSIWVDRYDARLLLETLPATTSISAQAPSSPTGWSDLPSDTEDTFFFTPDEVEDFRQKRRRLLDKAREERLKARMEEDGVTEEPKEEEDIWGGSDEEPDDTQSELMKRTAIHLSSSPNPAQLEMRILANHGGDRRFQFLRGRWSRAWRLAKSKAKLEKEKETEEKKKQEEAQKSSAGLGILAGYGSGDSDSEEEPPPPKAETVQTEVPAEQGEGEALVKAPNEEVVDEEAIKEARRKRLKEWTEKRRAAKASASDQNMED